MRDVTKPGQEAAASTIISNVWLAMCLIFLMCHESKCRTSDLKAQELFNFVFQIKCSIFLLANGSIFDKLREYDFVTL
jgi:hypothetical protein